MVVSRAGYAHNCFLARREMNKWPPWQPLVAWGKMWRMVTRGCWLSSGEIGCAVGAAPKTSLWLLWCLEGCTSMQTTVAVSLYARQQLVFTAAWLVVGECLQPNRRLPCKLFATSGAPSNLQQPLTNLLRNTYFLNKMNRRVKGTALILMKENFPKGRFSFKAERMSLML